MKFAIFDSCPPFVWRVKFAIWLIVVTAFVVSGCQRRQKKEMSATEPNIEPLVFIADYASGAINATGGMDVWMKTEKSELDCVVTFFEPDDSLYLTEHHFEVYPWLNSIKISAREPLSKFVWQLSNGQFSVLEGSEAVDVWDPALREPSPSPFSYRDYAEAVLSIITAPVRFLDESAVFIKEPGPVKMEGLWYYPIARTYPAPRPSSEEGRGTSYEGRAGTQPYWSKVVFFQKKDNSLVDMVWLAATPDQVGGEGPRSAGTQKSPTLQSFGDGAKFLAVRGYDYKEVEKGGVLVPTKIEIFKTDARAVVAERLVKIDFK